MRVNDYFLFVIFTFVFESINQIFGFDVDNYYVLWFCFRHYLPVRAFRPGQKSFRRVIGARLIRFERNVGKTAQYQDFCARGDGLGRHYRFKKNP